MTLIIKTCNHLNSLLEEHGWGRLTELYEPWDFRPQLGIEPDDNGFQVWCYDYDSVLFYDEYHGKFRVVSREWLASPEEE